MPLTGLKNPGTSSQQHICVVQLFSAQAIAAGQSATSVAVNIGRAAGFFAIQELITGDGAVKFEYLVSLDGVNFLEPTGVTDIATGQVKTSGPGTNGKDIISFTPIVAPYIKIKATETGGANAVAVTLYLAVQ